MSDTRDIDEVLRRLRSIPSATKGAQREAPPIPPQVPVAVAAGRRQDRLPRLPSGDAQGGVPAARRSFGTAISVLVAIALVAAVFAHRGLSEGRLSGASRPGDRMVAAEPQSPTAPSGLAALAGSGDPAAQYELGMNYASGRGVSKDLEAATHWLGLAAASGLPDAQYALGALKAKLAPGGAAEATALYQRAAQQDNVKAQYNLALAYADGIGVSQSYGTAVQWFERAALGGIGDAAFNLGVLYARGTGVPASAADAFVWFTLAAQGGVSDAASWASLFGARLTPADRRAAEARVADLASRIHGRTGVSAAGAAGGIGELISITKAQAEPIAPMARMPTAPDAAPVMPPPALIEACQRLLTLAHYEPGPANGVLTARTAEAIRKFQAVQHLSVDGQPSQALLVALRREANPLKPAE